MSEKSSLVGGPGQPLSAQQYQVGMEALADSFRMVQLMPLDDVRDLGDSQARARDLTRRP